jgi:hypothetical protein
MRRIIFFLLVITSFAFSLTSCQKSLHKTLPGEWWVSEINIEADPAEYDSVRISKIKEMEQSVYFVFHEDSTVEVKTGGTNIGGTWSIGDDKVSVYILMEGSRSGQPSLFGKYEKGLIKTDTKRGGGLSMSKVYKKR